MANNTAPCTSSNSPSLSDGNVHAKLVDTKQTGEYSGGRKEQNKQLLAKENITPPDGGWGWVVVFAAFIVYFIVFGTLRCQSVLFVPIMDVFRSDYSSVGWVAAVATTGLAVAGLLSAPLMAKIGHRYTIILGGFVACVASVLSYFAPNIIVLDLTAGLMTGVGLGMSFVSSPVLIGFYFEKKRALATNLASMGASVGTFAICPLNSLIIEQFSLRGYFLLFGGLFLQLCVCGALMRPVTSVAASVERRDEGSESMTEEQSEIEEVEESSPGSSTSWRSLAVHKPYIVYCISQIFFLAGFIVNQLYIVPFAEEELGVSSIKAPLVMSIMAGTELLSRIIFGFLGDLKRINRLLMFASVLLLLALCCLLIPFTNSFESLAGVSAVTGLFQGGFSGISIVVLADIVGIKLYGTALGISTTLNGIGTLLSPPLIGIAVNQSNKPSTALFISSGFLFLGAILTFMIHVVIRFEQKHHSPTTSEEE